MLLKSKYVYSSAPKSADIIYDSTLLLNEIYGFSFELISISLALASIYIRYGSVFWFTNKTLSFLITFIGFMASVEQILQLYSFIYISKQIMLSSLSKKTVSLVIQTMSANTNPNSTYLFDLLLNQTLPKSYNLNMNENNKLNYLRTIEGLVETNSDLSQLIRTRYILFFLYFILLVFVYLTATPAYVFAYLKYKERFLIEESLFIRSILSEKNPAQISFIENKNKPKYVSRTERLKSIELYNQEQEAIYSAIKDNTEYATNSTCCFNYCPHLIATIQLVIMCACKLPFCYDYIIYFNYFKDFGIMLNIIVEIMHTIILLFIWLSLTLKNDWDMHLQTAYSICHWTYHLKLKEKQRERSGIKKTSGEVAKVILRYFFFS